MMLRSLFGPSQSEILQELADDIVAEYVPGSFFRGAKLIQKYKNWRLLLDTYTVHTGQVSIMKTRVRVPFVNPGSFRFTLHNKNIFNRLYEFLGGNHLPTGDPRLNERFIIKSNRPEMILDLLESDLLREKILLQPAFVLHVNEERSWFKSDFPPEVTQLCYQAESVLKDPEQLRNILLLLAMLLERMVQIGLIPETDPEVSL
ncbi:MAG: hypothetical protein R3C11_10395 [Planctomycetaceae bacterium]